MTLTTNLGFPRIGPRAELRRAREAPCRGELPAPHLLDPARERPARHWRLQREAGIDLPPSNDFSLYDQVLDTALLFDAIPRRYRAVVEAAPLAGYFAMARGLQRPGIDLHALEMTKWFDTNYHYLVPELEAGQDFALRGTTPVACYRESRRCGIETQPDLIGPVTFLWLSKTVDGSDRFALLDRLVPAYVQLLEKLHAAGAGWVQVDEPALGLDLPEPVRDACRRAYAALAAGPRPKLMLASYFGALGDNLQLAASLPVDGLHLDLVRAPEQLEAALDALPPGRMLSLGLVDGRNVWRTRLDNALLLARYARNRLGADNVCLAPSCSLLHVPVDLDAENGLDPELRSWLSFAKQKLGEIRVLADALDGHPGAEAALEDARLRHASRRASTRVHRPEVAQRLATISPALAQRGSPYPARRQAQQAALALPPYPTTTIGSFPQTRQVREARAKFKSGKLEGAAYEAFLEAQTEQCVRFQEQVGIDVLVHGEFERNDMVEYFGEQLDGFAFTRRGWVQSYGSRCVKPPVIFGDVARPAPMTVRWARYAQSLTSRPVKGMLTGPVTLMQWSFVRDDQPHAESSSPTRRSPGPRRGRHRGDPDRRTGPARGPATAARALGRLPGMGGRMLPPVRVRGGRCHPDPHPHVLRRIQRHHPGGGGDGRGRDLDRDLALADGAAGCLRQVPLPQPDRPGRVRHPLPAHPHHRRDGGTARQGAGGAGAGPAVGEPGLRAEDTRLGGNGPGAAQDGRGGHGHPRIGRPVTRRGGVTAPPCRGPRRGPWRPARCSAPAPPRPMPATRP